MLSRSDDLLAFVHGALESLFLVAESHHGLIPSILDRHSLAEPAELPPAIPGQRDHDRALHGSNLIHDQTLLMTAYGIAEALDAPPMAAAADRYLEHFVRHCTHTPTGLFPWGEHSFWHLRADRVGDGWYDVSPSNPKPYDPIHDHLRAAPLWLWERIAAIDPAALSRFGDGLKCHWNKPGRSEYVRHAHINRPDPYITRDDLRSCDFPRHGGFYIVDWAAAWVLAGRADLRVEIEAMLEYWWRDRDEYGLLMIQKRVPPEDRTCGLNGTSQTLSLAVCLLEAAELLQDVDPGLASTMREHAATYIDGFLAAPHDLAAGVFLVNSDRATNSTGMAMPIWGSVYGNWPASAVGIVALLGYRLTRDDRLLHWAQAVGDRVRGTKLPTDVAVPGMDVGLAFGLLAELYDVTGDSDWLDIGFRLAEPAMSAFGGGRIPRGGVTVDYYDSQMGPAFLLHGLARLALLDRLGPACPLAADSTAR